MLFKQLLNYNIHIGHKYKNSTLLASWMLFKIYNNLWLINLYKTIWFFKLIFNFIKILVSKNSPIWFINSEMSKQYIINQNAITCGEFYCGYIWKRGLLSNYSSMLRIIKNILIKKDVNINSDFYFFFKTWYLTRLSWPRAVFVSNLKNYNVISKEAFTARVPVIGIIDTNIKNYYVNFPIPSNDDSLISLAYISSVISKHILLYKYKKVILWFLYYIARRKYMKFFNILNSLEFLYSKDINKDLNIFLKLKRFKKIKFIKMHFNKFNFFNILKIGIKYLFKQKKIKKIKKNIFTENQFNISNKYIFFFNLIQIVKIKKKKISLYRERSSKLNLKFLNLKFLNLESRIILKPTYYIQKWYYFYYYLFYMRFFKIFISTFENRNFDALSKVSLFYNSYEFNTLKSKIYNKKKDTWFTYRRFFNLLKRFGLLSYNLKTFNQKLKFYKKLIYLEFKMDYESIFKKPKYILTNLFAQQESFLNKTAKQDIKKYVNSFSINFIRMKDINKIIEKELYIIFLIRFININVKNYKNVYGNRKII